MSANRCPKCGLINPPSALRCDCGFDFASGAVKDSYLQPGVEKTSGRGEDASIPSEIRRWNWGAFYLNWIWGLSHGVYFALLVFVPGVNIAIPFILGAKGNEYAWRNRKWESIDSFLRAQRIWSYCGFAALVASIALFTISKLA